MMFDDGSTAQVPQEKVIDALHDGGQVAHHMIFTDNSQAYVPHSKYDAAIADGGRPLDTAPSKATGEIRNDVGNTVIVPKEGESFQDTMNRAAAQGKKTTPEMISKEVATMPGKVLDVLSASTAIGATAGLGSLVTGGVRVAASEGAVPSLKALWQIAKMAEADSEVAGSEVSSIGWKKFAEVAAKGAAEAQDVKTAAAYKGAAVLAKAYSTYEAAWAWLGKTIPGAPISIKIALAAKIVKEGYDAVMSEKKEEASK